jgi:Ser/Thr protein kinase RdoA (MazF antagonist)
VPRTAAQSRDIGRVLARVDRALHDFSHPSADHPLVWDLKRADRVGALVPADGGRDRRWSIVRDCLTTFEDRVRPYLPALRAQVIHNDFNTYNLLVDPADTDRVAGVLDFGDIVRAPLVNEVAIAMTYQLSPAGDPLDRAADLLAAYHASSPLDPLEIGLLYDLVRTRLAVAVTITEWRAKRQPDNRAYILKNTAFAWNTLERLAAFDRDRATGILSRACRVE